jgi:aliphatic nitrilase
MGDEYPTIRAAAVQAASVFMDREGSIEKACRLIREAGENGARLIAFPEGFIPGHPIWFHFHPGTDRVSTHLSVELFKNAVEIPGPHIEPLQAAARDAKATVVIGLCEKLPGTFGTLYNTQLFIGSDGSLLGRHRKIMPTVGERLVHTGGQGDGLLAFDTDFGRASALICGENSNPLAIFTMTAQYPLVHVQSWPNHFPTFGDPLRHRVMIDSQAFAQMSKAWVVASCGTIDDRTVELLELTDEQEAAIRNPDFAGGSVIVDPMSHVVAGPMGAEEGILYADMDLELGIRMKLRHDFAGHYNRPDIFEFNVHAGADRILALPGMDGPVGRGVLQTGGRWSLGAGAADPAEADSALTDIEDAIDA